MKKFLIVLFFLLIGQQSAIAQQTPYPYAENAYLQGRSYYLLRSGRAKMVVQADRVGLTPAFSYLLFDLQTPSQSERKTGAYNFTPETKFYSSALQVRMKSFAFEALPQTTSTQWTEENGIPAVSCDWWASGFQVNETITPIGDNGLFCRKITLHSADLVTTDTAFIRLSLPQSPIYTSSKAIFCQQKDAVIGLSVSGDYPVTIDNRSMEIGPIVLAPKETTTVTSFLLLDVKSPSIAASEKKITETSSITPLLQTMQQRWAKTNRIETPDTVVQSMYSASRNTLPGFIADNGAMDAGIFEYGAQWVRDASNTCLGAIHIGEFETARAMLEYMLTQMITEEGTTMIAGGFDEPDREQFDQMGEFVHAMKSYVDWSGDTTLLTQYQNKIVKMIERPLNPVFRDETGMVHNRREFWERTFDDAYELAYQMWVIKGLQCAATLSKYLNAEEKAPIWLSEADKIQHAMLNHPSAKLIEGNHLIKRRNVKNKQPVTTMNYYAWVPGAPGGVESQSSVYPDATMALPVAMNLIDPKSELARNTILETEKLWNLRWNFGGHDRYNTSSEGDQPGPWPFATAFILRGEHEAGLLDLSRRSLEWLYQTDIGKSGIWYEEIPIIHAGGFTSGLITWTTGEIAYFTIHHLLGIKFDDTRFTIKPNLYHTTAPIKADLRYRSERIQLEITGSGSVKHALINGEKIHPDAQGRIVIPNEFKGGTIKIITR